MKHCNACGADKPPSDFYARGGYCRKCCVAKSVLWQQKNREHYNARRKLWRERNYERERPKARALERARYWKDPDKPRAKMRRQNIERPEIFRIAHKRWRSESPERVNAHRLVHYAVKIGFLVRPECCSECGESPGWIEAHHDDYMKPLDVRWLCRRCHGAKRRITA